MSTRTWNGNRFALNSEAQNLTEKLSYWRLREKRATAAKDRLEAQRAIGELEAKLAAVRRGP